MTKILDADIVKTGNGKCNFCKKYNVNGILGELEINERPLGDLVRVVDGYEWVVPFFGESHRKIIGKPHFEYISKESKTKIIHPLICNDCVKEFAKLIK